MIVHILLVTGACSPNNAPATDFQPPALSDAKAGLASKIVDCNKPDEYSFNVVADPERKNNPDWNMPKNLNITTGEGTVATIKLPIADDEVKNFALRSVEKTKGGFELRVEWGGGNYFYEIQFDFSCKENNFYLYRVRNDNFSTTDPSSHNLLDKKETKTTKVEPNVPIENFVMLDYLQ